MCCINITKRVLKHFKEESKTLQVRVYNIAGKVLKHCNEGSKTLQGRVYNIARKVLNIAMWGLKH
jgi:hypothetical protein